MPLHLAPPITDISPQHSGTAIKQEAPAFRDSLAIRWLGWVARLILAGLFFWAGISKLLEPEVFLQDIASYELLLPYRWAWLVSIWLPFLEIAAAAALLTTRRWARAGAVIVGGMLLVFLAAILSAWVRGLSLSCGCFGSSDQPANYPWLVIRDLLMLGLVAVILLTTKHTNNAKS